MWQKTCRNTASWRRSGPVSNQKRIINIRHYHRQYGRNRPKRAKQWMDPQQIEDRSLWNIRNLEDAVCRRQNITPKMYTKAIKGCIDTDDKAKGEWIERELILKDSRRQITNDEVLWTCLMSMHFHFEDVDRAESIWKSSQCGRTISAWNAMMSGLLRNKKHSECLKMWNQRKPALNTASYGVAMRLFIDLERNESAIGVFEEWRRSNWNRRNDGGQRDQKWTVAECKLLILALSAAGNVKDIAFGMEVHRMWLWRRIQNENQSERRWSVSLQNAVISFYGKCGDILSAERVWTEMVENGEIDSVSLNAMMSALIGNGTDSEDGKEHRNLDCALNLFWNFREHRNAISFINALRACIRLKSLEKGLAVWKEFERWTECNESERRKMNLLRIELHGECDDVEGGRSVFDELSNFSDISASNRMMNVYAERGDTDSALLLMAELTARGIEDVISYQIALKAATIGMRLDSGRAIDALISDENRRHRIGMSESEKDQLQNQLVNLYGKCGDLEAAEAVWNRMTMEHKIRSIVPWNVMMNVFVVNNETERVLALRREMKALNVDHLQNEVTYSILIMALLNGKQTLADGGAVSDETVLHRLQMLKEIEREIVCSSNEAVFSGLHLKWLLIRAFWEYGDIERALQIWNHSEDLKAKDVLYWNLFIGLCIANDLSVEFIFDAVHQMMRRYGIHPDTVTLTLLAKLCADKALSEQALWIHGLCRQYLDSQGKNTDINVVNVLIAMHSKCGHLRIAIRLWLQINRQHRELINVSTWNSIINALAIHNYGRRAFQLFERMKQCGYRPDHITYCTVITACSHSLLFDKVHQVVGEMNQNINTQ